MVTLEVPLRQAPWAVLGVAVGVASDRQDGNEGMRAALASFMKAIARRGTADATLGVTADLQDRKDVMEGPE